MASKHLHFLKVMNFLNRTYTKTNQNQDLKTNYKIIPKNVDFTAQGIVTCTKVYIV